MIDMIANIFTASLNLIRLSLIKVVKGGRITFNAMQFLSFGTTIRIGRKGRIILGRSTQTRKGVALLARSGTIDIGDRVGLNMNCIITSHEMIEIGDNCVFGPNVMIFDHDHDYKGKTGGFLTSPIRIGNNVWVGANVVILRGTTIGDNSVIGAGSVIKGDIPADCVVVQKRENCITKIER